MTPHGRRYRVISFPTQCRCFVMANAAPKGQPTPMHYAHTIGLESMFTPPIDLELGDFIWIDVRNGSVEMIERGGFVIYRSGWRN